jgi:protein-tyrosine phosphatase
LTKDRPKVRFQELKNRILFVCLGNICRSPLAKHLFEHHTEQLGLRSHFTIDSAGTSGLHAGENADPRTIENAKTNGIAINHRARQFQETDFDNFDHIIVMDESNKANVLKLAQSEIHRKKVHMMRKWDKNHPNSPVPDPWYGGSEGFQEVFDILNRSTRELLLSIKE